jgi:XTP/dITP diphosphohydrolase
MQKLLIASQNKGKLEEIYSLLSDIEIELVSPMDLGLNIHVQEDGLTYHDNAVKKAKAYSKISNLLTLADDTGLEVEALHGKPGLYSARFSSKPNATDRDRRQKLLQQLSPFPQPWKARFICFVAIFKPTGEVFVSEGYCPGEVIAEERGEHGFGYDSIFLVSGSGCTMAELEMNEKNKISHRSRAISAIKPRLIEILRGFSVTS